MKVSIDLGLCQGHAMCSVEAPEVFGFDEDTDQGVILLSEPPEALHESARRAAKYCPALAIEITD